MNLSLRALVVVAAAVAIVVLAIAVLLNHPTHQVDLLAWAGVATAVALLIWVAPESPRA